MSIEGWHGQRWQHTGHGRQEHAARLTLVWAAGARRPEVEEALRSLELESFILTKLTKPSVPINLIGPQVSLQIGRASCRERV